MKIFHFCFRLLFVSILLFYPCTQNKIMSAQEMSDGSSFGFDEAEDGFGLPGPAALSLDIGGEAGAELSAFIDDFASAQAIKNIHAGNIFRGGLNFNAASPAAEAVINLKLSSVFDGSSPVKIDEAFVRAFFGPLSVEGGILKLTWGKADSLGPLDVINPLDYTDLTKIGDPQSVKIARPMIHLSWSPASFSKLEGVFVPWYQGHQFASSGRWAPAQITQTRENIAGILTETGYGIQTSALSDASKAELLNAVFETGAYLENALLNAASNSGTDTLEYFQAGARFTSTIGSSDIGVQYYFGRLPRPAVGGINPAGFFTPASPVPQVTDIHPETLVPDIRYNFYHQIGADFARVVAGFNLRAEAGANITNDIDGKDGMVYNPALVWSLGFDRNLFWNVNLNLQGTGTIRLFHDRISSDPLLDCEAGSNVSSTRISARISRNFLRDELELNATALWGIEDKDFLVMPALIWSRSGVRAELSAGFFGGDKKGELGQYKDNDFMKVSLTYSF